MGKGRKRKSIKMGLYRKHGKSGYIGRSLLLLAGLAALLLLVPIGIVQFFSADRQEQKLVFDQVEVEAPEILVWLEESDTTVSVPLEEYIACVVSEEMPASFHSEALKAQAVAARTYSVARTLNFTPVENPQGHQKAALCNTTHCQVYQTQEQIRQNRSEEWMEEYWPKICHAVEMTEGQVMYYDGKLAGQAMFHSSSGGKTENSEDVFASAVPYLRSVDSPYEEGATHQNETVRVDIDQAVQLINSQLQGTQVTREEVEQMQVVARSSGNRAQSVQIGSVTMTGRELRSLFGLSSSKFDVSVEDDKLVFISNGYGHGVGLSQYGANGMGEKGYRYDQILEHYYTGIQLRTLQNAG